MRSLATVLAVVLVFALAGSASARPAIDPPSARGESTAVLVSQPVAQRTRNDAPTILWILAGFGAAGIIAVAGLGVARATHRGGHRPAGQH